MKIFDLKNYIFSYFFIAFGLLSLLFKALYFFYPDHTYAQGMKFVLGETVYIVHILFVLIYIACCIALIFEITMRFFLKIFSQNKNYSSEIENIAAQMNLCHSIIFYILFAISTAPIFLKLYD